MMKKFNPSIIPRNLYSGGMIGGGGEGFDLSTKGQIHTHDGSGNQSALSVGTNNQILSADSTETTGLKWIDNSGGSPTISTLLDLTGSNSGDYRWSYQGEGGSSYQRASGVQITDSDNALVGKVVTKITVWARRNSGSDSTMCMFFGSGLGLESLPNNWESTGTIPRPQGIPAEEGRGITSWSQGSSGSGVVFNFHDHGIRCGVGSYFGIFALDGFSGCCSDINFRRSTETGADKFNNWSYDQQDKNFFDIRTNEAMQWKFEGYDPDA